MKIITGQKFLHKQSWMWRERKTHKPPCVPTSLGFLPTCRDFNFQPVESTQMEFTLFSPRHLVHLFTRTLGNTLWLLTWQCWMFLNQTFFIWLCCLQWKFMSGVEMRPSDYSSRSQKSHSRPWKLLQHLVVSADSFSSFVFFLVVFGLNDSLPLGGEKKHSAVPYCSTVTSSRATRRSRETQSGFVSSFLSAALKNILSAIQIKGIHRRMIF